MGTRSKGEKAARDRQTGPPAQKRTSPTGGIPESEEPD